MKKDYRFFAFFIIFNIVFLSSASLFYAQEMDLENTADLDATLAELKMQAKELIQKNKVLTVKNQELRNNVHQLNGKLDQLKKKKESLLGESLRLNEIADDESREILLLKQNIKNLKRDRAWIKNEQKTLGREIKEKEEENAKIKEEIDALQNQISQYSESIKIQKAATPVSSEKLDILQEQQRILKDQFTSIERATKTAVTTQQTLREKSAKIKVQEPLDFGPLEEEIMVLRERQKELQTVLVELQNQLTSKKFVMAQFAVDEKQLEERISVLEGENRFLQQEAFQLIKSKIDLEKRMDMVDVAGKEDNSRGRQMVEK